MANKNLFSVNATVKPAVVNDAGGRAYTLSHKQALANYACMGTFNGTYYADASVHLDRLKEIVKNLKSEPEFVAKVAVYSRNQAYMKDMPAFLCAQLAAWGEAELFRKVFRKVIDNGKMLRNFIQIGRSGQTGKVLNMSSGAIRHAIRDWFKYKKADYIFRNSIGNDPNMRDILRMARPTPSDDEKAALFGYLKGAQYVAESDAYVTYNRDGSVMYTQPFGNLPQIVKDLELFKRANAKGDYSKEVPEVDFRLLDSVVTPDQAKKLWVNQARNGGWHMLRMNLNNFVKYGVFDSNEMVDLVAERLRDREAVLNSKVFPYQIMTSYLFATNAPQKVRSALQDAMEIAVENTPTIEGSVYVCVDTSGSMTSPITGQRPDATTVVNCVQVAGLYASCVLRKNGHAKVIPFDTSVHLVDLNERDTVLTNTQKLNRLGGGTDCSSAMRYINQNYKTGDVVIFISDYESWVDSGYGLRATGLMSEWNTFKGQNPRAKLVCMDLTPRTNHQVKEHKDILQVGGFSEEVFNVVASFLSGDADNWLNVIGNVSLD